MFQKISHQFAHLIQQWHDQFATFKAKVKGYRNEQFPHLPKKGVSLSLEPTPPREPNLFSTHRIVIFWAVGLLFVAIGYLVYHTLSYLYMLIAAGILSVALEGIITFWSRLTRSRGVGIAIAYLLLFLFLLSGFAIIVPFLVNRGTQILQSITIATQEIQSEILTQGIDAYVRSRSWIPSFLHDDILKYISTTNSASFLHTITENLGNIMNLSSSYIKTIGSYAMNIFGNIFSVAGKIVLFFTLSIFFSLAHFEVRYGMTFLFRRIKQSKEKIDEVYTGIATRLKSQLLLCVFIGITSYVGLRILDWIGFAIPQKGVLALLAGIFEIIPYLGPFLGGLPAAVFAVLLYGFPGFIAVALTYTLLQQAEEKLFVPILMSRTLGVNPLLVFVCMLLGATIMGVYGIILAVPIAVIFSIVFKISKEAQKEEKAAITKPRLSKKTLK